MNRPKSMTLSVVLALTLVGCAVAGCATAPASIDATALSSTPAPTASRPTTEGSQAPESAPSPEAIGFAIVDRVRTDLSKYASFEYQSATTTGLTDAASARADAEIAATVDAAVDAAVTANGNECGPEGEPCGVFVLTLKPFRCSDPYVCLKQTVGGVPVGSATGDEQVTLVVLDPDSGQVVTQDQLVAPRDRSLFLAAVNRAVYRFQKSEGYFEPDSPMTIKQKDIAAVAPIDSGLRVWLNKYAAGPGAAGVVAVTVPLPSKLTRSDTAAVWGPEVPEAGDMWDYLCWGDTSRLPSLPGDAAEISGAATIQDTLTILGYDPGPIDGDYGPTTQAAVRQFQSDQSLVVDGQVGQQTWGRIREMFCWQYQPPDPEDYAVTPEGTAANVPDNGGQSYSTVPNLGGLNNMTARGAAFSAGLSIGAQRYTNTDPSLAAISTGGCIVVDQSPRPGEQVPRGTAITVLLDCPLTGQ